MKLVTLSGGLGNQMFQYVFYLSLKAYDNNTFLYKNKIFKYADHNGYELERLFGVEKRCDNLWMTNLLAIKYLGVILKHILFPIKIRERAVYDFSKYSCWLNRSPLYGVHLVGYWQSESYFKQIEKLVRDTFVFDQRQLNECTRTCLKRSTIENAVSIHVRRGDYLLACNIQTFGNICDLVYYRNAVDLIYQNVNNPVFYVFSDDIEWAVENLLLPPNTVFVDWNNGRDSWQDMFLMSVCKHNIVANSSFSWWGAWLNNNHNKIVVAPARWVQSGTTFDVVPESWIKI